MDTRFLRHLLFKRATIQGILARDFRHHMPELRAHVSPWVKNQEIVLEETIIEGLSQLPNALGMLFEGKT
jgi:NADPH-dependent curcumin reductase CurA